MVRSGGPLPKNASRQASSLSREHLVAAAAIEDREIFFAVARANSSGLVGIVEQETIAVEHGRGAITQALASFFASRSDDLSRIAVSSPGAVSGTALIDIPRLEWSEVRQTAIKRGTVLLDFAALFEGLGYRRDVVLVDNDTPMAALGEREAQLTAGDHSDFAYIRAGRGINAAMVAGGSIIRGTMHSELGHITVQRHPEDRCECQCSFHEICLEGLVGSPAMDWRIAEHARSRHIEGSDALPPDPWSLAAYYIGQLCVTLTAAFAPPRILLGGALLRGRPHFLDELRGEASLLLDTYLRRLGIDDAYIQNAACKEKASLIGALICAQKSLSRPQ